LVFFWKKYQIRFNWRSRK